MTTRRSVKHLDTTFATIRLELGATVRQLHEWTGEYPASTSGAGPAHPGPPSDRDPSDDVKLTKTEADALNPDEARRALVRCYQLVDHLVVETGDLGDLLGGDTLPTPEERLAPRLAFIQWQINKVSAHRPALPAGAQPRLRSSVRFVNELADICVNYRPAPARTRPLDNCHAHDKANADAEIDRHYRKLHLCLWCGSFRDRHGVNPPPKLIKLHDRGVSMSTSLLRSAGITTTKKGA